MAGQREMEASVRREFGVGPYVKLEDLWPLVTLGQHEGALDGTLTPSELEAMKSYDKNVERQRQLATEAAAVKSALAKARRDKVRSKNSDLLGRVESGKRSRNSAVEHILKNWGVAGDGGKRPSKRTLDGWLAEKTLQDP
jgi:hypothetical protein